ncbi:MAG TPA: nucleoside recognition domain-containing protein [Myxococcota bacterium]|nr:nucleoside recognition domain-containing protein [Myxococcota bacterium]
MLNWIWLALIWGAVVYAAFTGTMGAVSKAAFDQAIYAVSLVIKLVGPMILFLGLMNVASQGGLLAAIARGLRPLMRRLFPEVPPDHPAMGAMVMNLASNVLGLGNAATPFGLKAMTELNRLNREPGVATDAMVLFLAINATSVTLMAPTGTAAVRAAAGSTAPLAIWIPTLIATACSTVTAVLVVYWLRRSRRYAVRPLSDAPAAPAASVADELPTAPLPEAQPMGSPQQIFVWGTLALLAAGAALELPRRLAEASFKDASVAMLEQWLAPLLILGLLLVGVASRVRVYEAMVAGAREGLDVAVRIVPYMVAILVAVGMFRASGLLDVIVQGLDPLTSAIGFPAAALPMALLRPLSGSGSFAVMSEILETQGPDSFVGLVASTLQGSTETTFYVLTVYCGAVGVRDVRHALPACLVGDLAGFAAATAACHLFFA